jgi:hypothetical protein
MHLCVNAKVSFGGLLDAAGCRVEGIEQVAPILLAESSFPANFSQES